MRWKWNGFDGIANSVFEAIVFEMEMKWIALKLGNRERSSDGFESVSIVRQPIILALNFHIEII